MSARRVVGWTCEVDSSRAVHVTNLCGVRCCCGVKREGVTTQRVTAEGKCVLASIVLRRSEGEGIVYTGVPAPTKTEGPRSGDIFATSTRSWLRAWPCGLARFALVNIRLRKSRLSMISTAL